MMIAIPPKYAVFQVVGHVKVKSAIHLARVYGERRRSFIGQHFWARRNFVSTVGRVEEPIREYIRNREQEDGKPPVRRAGQVGGGFLAVVLRDQRLARAATWALNDSGSDPSRSQTLSEDQCSHSSAG